MEKDRRENANSRGLIAAALVIALASAAIAVMAMLTLPSSDDFWYRTFLDGGIREYLSLMKRHYLTFNGRVLVHVADHIVLHLGNGCFAVVCVSLLLLVPALLTLASGRERRLVPWALALFVPAVLSLPRSILNQGIFWISAFFNYVLPTAMLTADILLFERALKRPRSGVPMGTLCVIWATACGATTEQAGIAAVLLAVWWMGKALFLRRGRLMTAVSLGGSAAGLASIFLSPATRARFGYGAAHGSLGRIVTSMCRNMAPASGELCSSWLTGAALAALFLLTGAALAKRRGGKWPLVAAALPAAAAVAVSLFPGGLRTAVFTALCFLAALASVLLMAAGEEAPGLLTLVGLVTLAVILVTDSTGGRTLLPFLLMLLASDAVLLSSYIPEWPAVARPVIPVALLIAGSVMAAPFIGGMLSNFRVERENIENTRLAHETGELRYCIDYDTEFTWTKLQTEFMEEYLAGEGLSPDTKVVYYSRLRPGVLAGGEPQYPTLVDEDGEVLVWVRLIEAFGGEVVPRFGYDSLTLVLPWMECEVETATENEAVFTWADGDGEQTRRVKRLLTESRTWFPLEVYTDILGFEAAFDGERNVYVFTAPEGVSR